MAKRRVWQSLARSSGLVVALTSALVFALAAFAQTPVIPYAPGTPPKPVGTFNPFPIIPQPSVFASYRAVGFGNAAYATPQDLACLANPANSAKTVYVTQLAIIPQATASSLQTFLFLKRTTLNSGGSSTAATAVALDSADVPAAASLVVYTALPTPGTSAGTLNQAIVSVSTTTTNPNMSGLFSVGNGQTTVSGAYPAFPAPSIDALAQPVTLHANEAVCINFNGVALPAGFTAGYLAEWTER